MSWVKVKKMDPRSAKIADGHYSRRTVGSPQFMPPGQTIILLHDSECAVFGWWRPDPASGIKSMNGLDGWTCTIFRNLGPWLSSQLIIEAETELTKNASSCGPDGLLTYVWDSKIASVNPGYCFKKAGWKVHPTKPRSADNKKTLLTKPYELAGQAV